MSEREAALERTLYWISKMDKAAFVLSDAVVLAREALDANSPEGCCEVDEQP